MPLQHSSSPEAFKSNLKAELAAGKPRDQALAIAYSVKRKGRAAGGSMPAMAPNSPQHLMRAEAQGMHRGPVMSAVPGRTDRHNVNIASSSYVIPADTVSHLGQNNSMAGMAVLNKMFGGGSSPYGAGKPMPVKGGSGAPRAPRIATGGATDQGGARGSSNQIGAPTPVVIAGGEYTVPVEQVHRIGEEALKREHGNVPINPEAAIKTGHRILDAFVMSVRKKHISTLKGLPPPAKS